jgi:hypothetical protein
MVKSINTKMTVYDGRFKVELLNPAIEKYYFAIITKFCMSDYIYLV